MLTASCHPFIVFPIVTWPYFKTFKATSALSTLLSVLFGNSFCHSFFFKTWEYCKISVCSEFLLDGENRPKIKKSTPNQNVSDENQTHKMIMETLTGDSFWYSILGRLWDFEYQLELNQENQQRYLEQVSFTHKKIDQEILDNPRKEVSELNQTTVGQGFSPILHN